MSDDNQPDLDLIRMVQNARMQHDAEAMPSQSGGVYWIEAKRRDSDPQPTSRAGYWLIVTTASEADALWAAIKAATEAGQLGYKSKVATASRGGPYDERMIHVMTYDADDGADVARVRAALAVLGVDAVRYMRGE
jgi:hypothetical protein